MASRALVCGAVVASSAEAAPEPGRLPNSLGLAIEDCRPEAVGERAARDALVTELRSDGVAQVHSPALQGAEAELRVSVLCESGVQTQVSLSRASTGKVAAATLSLSDITIEERPRALALAASELVRGYWAVLAERDARVELSPLPAPPPESTRQPPPPERSHAMLPDEPQPSPAIPVTQAEAGKAPLRASPPEPSAPTFPQQTPERDNPLTTPAESTRTRGASAAFATRLFARSSTLFLGGALELKTSFLRASAEGFAATRDDQLGRVSAGIGNVRVAALVEVWRGGAWSWAVGPRAAFGVTWATANATGTAPEATPETGAAIDLYADAAAETEIAHRAQNVQTLVALEVGAARGIAALAADRAVTTSGGLFVGTRLGVRYTLP